MSHDDSQVQLLEGSGYRQMNLEYSRPTSRAKRRLRIGFLPSWISLLSVLVTFPLLSGSSASAQVPVRKTVLIINEMGLTHALTVTMTQQIITGVRDTTGRQVEFYSENLDLLSFPDRPSLSEQRDALITQYGHRKLDAIVAIGPDTIKFLSNYADTLFSGVPIVICGSSADQAGDPNLDSRFTGTWQKREPGKTFEAALLLFPNTRHVFVVGGSSVYDRVVMAFTREFFSSSQTRVEFSYLTDMEMEKLLEKLKNLPENSIVFYTSFLQDSVGNKFLNATKALPMVASAANAPIFAMSDTYLGHGIVGGDLMNFQEQGKVTARIVSELLEGKKIGDLPIETLPSTFMFDWNELKRWHISESRLPAGSIIFFRPPSLWERTKWIWTTGFLIILVLSALAAYLLYAGKQLKLARSREGQLSGMLINAEEQERQRIASELHDDFSQRLAVLALRLENVDEATPASFPDIHRQLRELVQSTGEIGADIHSLSHQLHSSTLESLGLVPALAALCKEFTALQTIKVDFIPNEIPRSVHPDVALCVFRIVQEGLRNLKKHSGAEEAQVDLRMTGDRLDVTVRDEGCGFDLRKLRQNGGLGIRSMKERAHLLGGKFEIFSETGKGTTLKAWVPLEPQPGLEKG
jgi:signal transduction histidine kinase